MKYAFPKDGEGVAIYYGNGGEGGNQPSNGSTGEQTGGSFDWPSGIPDYVPQLEGDIFSAGCEETNERVIYYIVYENIKDAGVDSYENQLRTGGWNIFLKQEVENSWMLHAKHEKKGDLVVTVNEEDKIGSINFGMDK